MTLLRDRIRDWLGAHLDALVWILVTLWGPPVIFTVMVNLHLVGGAGSGYPSMRDPALLLGVMQLALMVAALPLIYRRKRSRAWQLLCGSLAVWAAHAAWSIVGRLRLLGRRDLASRETLITVAALAAAAVVLFEVRARCTRPAPTAQPTTDRPPVALQPDTM